ncbi:MAG TPA: hypothetical protein VN699_12055, partial [Pirellulales bacterium]|nr:hypothetical protein [Pirellulales bacterium]
FTVTGGNTYAEEGSYPVSVAISDHGSPITVASPAQVADAPLAASGMTISSTEGAAFNGAVATFTDADPNGVASDYAATIAWGDGQTSAGVISGSQAAGFTVTGANTYAEEGSYPLSVAISDHGATATAASTAQVADAALTAVAFTPPAAVEGAPFFGTVFHFTDANPSARFVDYTATVNLGDGNSLTLLGLPSLNGEIVPNPQGGFDVQLSHTYAEEMSGATFSVSVRDAGGSTIAASTNNFSVADAPLTAGTFTPPAAVEGAAFNNLTVFHFSDANPAGKSSDYSATVNLGDGNNVTLTSAAGPNGQIVANPGGGFDVQLSYIYAEELSGATFSVSVSDAGGSSTSASTSAFSVADAALTAGSFSPPVATEGQAFGPVTVFHFTDANPSATVADYTATVNTGNATLTSAANPGNVSIVANPSGGFDVQLSYAYAEELSGATFSVSVSDAGGSSTSASTGAFSVADAPLTSNGVNFKALDGIATGQTVVATFIDQGGPEAVSDYGATIDWGDGNSSSATIVANNDGSFSVKGSHTYAGVGGFVVTASITHENGIAATATSAATVEFGGGLLVLDPTGLGALSEIGNGKIQVNAGDIRVDSNNGAAVVALGNGTISASELMVAGTPGVFTLGKASIAGTVEPGAPALADPLSGVPAPVASQTPLPAVNAHGSQHLTLNPGTYLGGIQASGNAVVTLNPGVYYLEGGGLSISGNATLTGNGVTIYNGQPAAGESSHDWDDNAINVSGQGALTISAPTSGPLKNIAIFQDRTLASPILITGNSTVQLMGLVYGAQAALVVSGNAQLDIAGDAANGLVAACVCDDVSVLGNAALVIGGSLNPSLTSNNIGAPATAATGSSNSTDGGATDPAAWVRAQDDFFRTLFASHGGDDLSFWAHGAGQGVADDEIGLD